MTAALPWIVFATILLLMLSLLGRPLRALVTLLLRSCGAFFLLTLLQPVGLGVGANGVTALVVGLLGAPGFALLLMLQWTLR